MKVITLGFKGSMFVIFGVFRWVAASPPVFTESPYYSPSTLTEVGSLCKDAVGISMPGDGSPVIITGRHSKLFSFTDCSYSYKGPLPATVYQIEGTGALFDISMFSGPYGNENEVSVFEGCPDEESNGASNTGDDDYTDINDEEIYADTVYTCTQPRTLYTIVIYTYSGGDPTDFILRVGTTSIEAIPICGPEGESSISPIDLGTVNATVGSLPVLGGPGEGFVTDLPQCDDQVQSSSVLYQVTVGQPNVLVSVEVRFFDQAVVIVYQGNCESGYYCLTATDEISTSRSFYGYKVNSFHNEKAGTTYLVSISSCCFIDVSDFLLTVNATVYGDICEDSVAMDLSSGEASATINFLKEKFYRNLNACSDHYEYEQSSYPPGDAYYHGPRSYVCEPPFEPASAITGRTAFYTIAGDGQSYVAYAAPSDPDQYYEDYGQLRMALFTSRSCNEKLQCLQGDSYNNFLSFHTVDDETYYLAVSNENTDIPDFDLWISVMSSKSACQDAVDLGTVGTAGRMVEATTAGGFYYKNLDICNFYGEITRPRVFSFVAEEDGPMRASVVNVNGTLHFQPHVSVVMSCDNNDCIASLSIYEFQITPSAVWKAQAGTTYYVVVYVNDLIATGEFQLALEHLATVKICEREDIVDLGTIPEEGATYERTTESAPLFSVPESCQEHHYGYISAVSRAAAFSLPGDGSAYILSVSDAYSFSKQLSVYKGSCDALECVSSASNTFSFATRASETYTILVSDIWDDFGAGGSFKLHVKKIVAGNITADATETIGPNETKGILGSTSAGLFYPDFPVCYHSINSPASVYKLKPGVGFFTAQVTGFEFDAQVALLKEDDSGGFECYGRHDYQQVVWKGAEGKALYLVVFGCCDENAVGHFALRILQSSVPGEPCDDVLDLGSVTEDAGKDCYYADHYPFTEGRTKIFTVVGNGKSLIASIHVSQSTVNRGIDVSVTVLKGICGSFECIEGAYSDSYSLRSLTWASTAGETYHIVVSTCCSFDSGDDYVLMVYEEGAKYLGSGYRTWGDDNKATGSTETTSSSKLIDGTSLFAAVTVIAALAC